MKTGLFIFYLFFLSITSNAQINKGDWLVGGVANFSVDKVKNAFAFSATSTDNIIMFEISPSVGFFIRKQLALGIFPSIEYLNIKTSGLREQIPYDDKVSKTSFFVGPFIRYYFLKYDQERLYNILIDTRYQIGINNLQGNIRKFNVMAGPEIFFNSAVGIELLFGYYSQNETNQDQMTKKYKNSGFQVSLGFQIHLEN